MALESAIYVAIYGLNMIGHHVHIELRLPQLATPDVYIQLNSSILIYYIYLLIIQPILVIKRLPFHVLYFCSAFYTTSTPFRSVPFHRIYPT